MKNGSKVQLRYLNMKNNNIPDIRFPGFTDDWEQRKLSSICSMHARIGWQNLRTSEFLDTGEYYLITGTDFDDGKVNLSTCHYVAKERYDQDKKIQIKNGSILITKDGTLGKVALVEELDKPATLNAGVFNVEIVAENIDNKYLFQYLKAPFLMDYVDRKATGGTIKHLNQNILVDFPVWLSDYEEQKRVGLFFQQLDCLITLHQNELDVLKKTKKGFLQEMFPKEGEIVPEVRFPGFTDDWEQRKLGEMADFSKGNCYSKSDLTDEGEPVILYGRLYTKYETVISTVDTFTAKKENSVISKGNEVIIPASGETAEDISRAAVVAEQGIIIGGDLNIVRPYEEIDSIFLALTISNGKQQKELSRRAQGKSIVHLHNSDLKEVDLIFPRIDEQIRIGFFFKQLDNTIALHQRELDVLKKTKKAFLQKMFINS